MRFTVTWRRAAENHLAEEWMAAPAQERVQITSAAHAIDQFLAVDATDVGESRGPNCRILFVPPLAVHFEVREPDRIVVVLAVRNIHPRHGPT
jgi:hypothetical protein